MKAFNWTDCKHPCFVDYTGDPDDESPNDCDWFDGESEAATCFFKESMGGSWNTCHKGRLSHWQDWLPKEGKNE